MQPVGEWTLASIVASWKKFTARRICDWSREWNEGQHGPDWHREYWDRYIRDRGHFEKVVEYIHMNPVKAGLALRAEDWRWSSAYLGKPGQRG
jgi:type I restriction enzyme R subunit/putative DNA methylase